MDPVRLAFALPPDVAAWIEEEVAVAMTRDARDATGSSRTGVDDLVDEIMRQMLTGREMTAQDVANRIGRQHGLPAVRATLNRLVHNGVVTVERVANNSVAIYRFSGMTWRRA